MKAKQIRKWRWNYWDVDPSKLLDQMHSKQAMFDNAIQQVQEDLTAKGMWKAPAVWSAKMLDSGIIRVCRRTINDPQHLGPWNKGTKGVSKGGKNYK